MYCHGIKQIYQARNQEFFRAGEFSSNWGTLINIQLQHFDKHSPTPTNAPQGKNLRVFPLETLKNFVLNEKLYHS